MNKSPEVEALEKEVVAAALECWRKSRENLLAERAGRSNEHAEISTSSGALAVLGARVMVARARSYMYDADMELLKAAARLESAMKKEGER